MKQSHPRTAENARNGGSGQLCKQSAGLAGKGKEKGVRAFTAVLFPRENRKFARKSKIYSKWFVLATKCVSGNDFGVSFILSKQIFPSHKTILEMNKPTSPNGDREEW